jgi:hypothetical protein
VRQDTIAALGLLRRQVVVVLLASATVLASTVLIPVLAHIITDWHGALPSAGVVQAQNLTNEKNYSRLQWHVDLALLRQTDRSQWYAEN